MFRDCKYNPTRKETLLCLWFCSGSALSLVRIVSALCPQSSGHFADVVRLSLGWRSPRRGTIKPLEPWVSKLQRVPACVARCSAIAKPVAFLLGMWRYCKTNTARNGCWCLKPGPVDHNCIPGPACVARSIPARIRSIEETASSPGPVDYNCNPVPACVARSIPARIDLSRKPHRVPAPWITTATRPGVSRSMNRPNGATLSSLA